MADSNRRSDDSIEIASNSRRNLLKKIGAAGVLTFVPTSVAASSGSDVQQSVDEELNLDFEPENKRQVVKFVMDSMDLDDEQKRNLQTRHDRTVAQERYTIQLQQRRDALRAELTKRQINAIAEVVADMDVKTDTEYERISDPVELMEDIETADGVGVGEQDGQTGPSSENDYSYFEESTTVTPKTSVEICLPRLDCVDYEKEVAEWTHEVSWEGNEDWPPDVRSINADLFGNGKSYAIINWIYKGLSQLPDTTVHADGQYFRSDAEGKFGRNVLLDGGFTKVKNDYIFTEVVGSSNGSFNHTKTRINGNEV